VTAITVTHDQEEAFALADRVVLLRAGQVVQVGTPEGVYRRPASAWAARFLGLTNLLDASAVGRGMIETMIGTFQVQDFEPGAWGLPDAQLLIRPEAARLDVSADDPNLLRGVVVERSFRGERYRLGVRHASGVELTFSFPASVTLPALGESVTLSLDPRALALLPVVDIIGAGG
jgi:ABC-type Fe3+/spermidine/putrescine transport system ATPase subunit